MRQSSARHTPGSLRAQQELLVQRRIMEEQRQSAWNKNSMDIQKANCDASAYQKLISDRTYRASLDNYMRQQIEERKCTDMQVRRAELTSLLFAEETKYQNELADCLKDTSNQRVKDMQERVEHLRQTRIKQQEQIVAEKLHDAWRKNCPELREAASKQLDLETSKAWGDQIRIRHENDEEERKMEQRMVDNMKRELEFAEEKDRERSDKERARMQDLTETWQQQIDSLKKHEDQIRVLQQQEREYLYQLSELSKLEDQRSKYEELEKRKDFGRALIKQHAAHIRRRHRQVQEGIEYDRKLLESLNQMEQESVMKDQQKKEHARSVAAQMRDTMEHRLRIEKDREREIDRLDREEAKLYWERREQEWTAEEEARKNLVGEVIHDLREQLRQKMLSNRQAQQEVENGKEELAAMMKLSEMDKQRELDCMTRAQSNRRDELEDQMRALEKKEQDEKFVAMDEHVERQMRQQNYEDFLANETAKMGIGLKGSRSTGAAPSRPSSMMSRM